MGADSAKVVAKARNVGGRRKRDLDRDIASTIEVCKGDHGSTHTGACQIRYVVSCV